MRQYEPCIQIIIIIIIIIINKKFIRVFSKQHSLASQDSLVVGSIGWEFCGVAGTLHASRGGGVSSWYLRRVLGNLCY